MCRLGRGCSLPKPQRARTPCGRTSCLSRTRRRLQHSGRDGGAKRRSAIERSPLIGVWHTLRCLRSPRSAMVHVTIRAGAIRAETSRQDLRRVLLHRTRASSFIIAFLRGCVASRYLWRRYLELVSALQLLVAWRSMSGLRMSRASSCAAIVRALSCELWSSGCSGGLDACRRTAAGARDGRRFGFDGRDVGGVTRVVGSCLVGC